MRKTDDIEAILATKDWPTIQLRLVEYTRRRLRGGSIETAKEIAQEALTRLWDPEYRAWDPATQPDLLQHLGSVVNGIVQNLHTSAAARLNIASSSVSGVAEAPVDPLASPCESDADRRLDAARVVDRLLAHLSGKDKILTDLLLLFVEGIDKAAEQAAELGCDVSVVYSARRRFETELGIVRAELGAGEKR